MILRARLATAKVTMCGTVRAASAFAALAAAVAMGPNSARAADAARCDAFVAASLNANSKVHSLSCGSENDPKWWTSDANVYRRFCNGARNDTIDNLMGQIRDFVVKCSECRQFADKTALQQQDSDKKRCGFSFDPAAAFSVCMSYGGSDSAMWLPESLVSKYVAARDTELAECSACRDYEKTQDQIWNQYLNVYHCTGLKRAPSGDGPYYPICIRNMETYGYDKEADALNRDNAGLEGALDQCKAAKKDQIEFCERYVRDTHDLVRKLVGSGCIFSGVISISYFSDGRYSMNDETRLSWCMGLKTSQPNGDPDYQAVGPDGKPHDPVDTLNGALAACHTRQILSTRPQDLKLGTGKGQNFGAKFKVESSESATPGTGHESSSKAIGPGLLENEGGIARQGPAATGTPRAPPGGMPANPNYGR
jgi:hypothetical protein